METSSVKTSSSRSRGRRFQQPADYSTSESSGGRRFQQAADDFSSVSLSQDEQRSSAIDSEYNNQQVAPLSRDDRAAREDNLEIEAESEILYVINKNGISLQQKNIPFTKKIMSWMFSSYKINIFLLTGTAVLLWWLMVFNFNAACYGIIKWAFLFTLLCWLKI